MTHCVIAMLVAVLLQPPAPPAKPQPAPEVKVDGPGAIVLNERLFSVENPAVTHPDIRVAEARLMEAQAMLDQAKLKVAIESRMNKAKYDQAKADVATLTKRFEQLRAVKSDASRIEHDKVADELQAAKRQLAIAELLTQATKEVTQAPKRTELSATNSQSALIFMHAMAGSPPVHSQPLQDLLQRKVKFSVKDTDTDNSVIGVLERSMKEWDLAGAKVIVRYPQASKAILKDAPFLQPVEGESTVGVWLLLMLDEFNNQTDSMSVPMRGKHQIYVREYGLLFTLVKNAPDGAPTLAEFLRQAKR